MKTKEMLVKWPAQFPIWNLNEDTDVLWTNISNLEDKGFFDPWGQKINLRSARKKNNSAGDTVEYVVASEFQNHPVELVIINE